MPEEKKTLKRHLIIICWIYFEKTYFLFLDKYSHTYSQTTNFFNAYLHPFSPVNKDQHICMCAPYTYTQIIYARTFLKFLPNLQGPDSSPGGEFFATTDYVHAYQFDPHSLEVRPLLLYPGEFEFFKEKGAGKEIVTLSSIFLSFFPYMYIYQCIFKYI